MVSSPLDVPGDKIDAGEKVVEHVLGNMIKFTGFSAKYSRDETFVLKEVEWGTCSIGIPADILFEEETYYSWVFILS